MAHLDKKLVWEKPDGTLEISHLDDRDIRAGETEDAFIARYTAKLKTIPALSNVTPVIIEKSKIPTDRAQRDEWSFDGNKIKVDPDKVAAKAAKEAAKEATLATLGVTKEQLKEALE